MEKSKIDNLRKNMKIKFDFNNMMDNFIGDQGITESQIYELTSHINECIISLKEKRKTGLDWMNLPYTQMPLIKKILNIANDIKNNYDDFVVVGIGGQALGPIAVQEALNHPYYNELPKEKRNGCPRFYVQGDNADPEKLNALFDIININKTKFFISSKSGNTPETISQFIIITDLLKKKIGEDFKDNIICLTNANNGSLLELIKREGYDWLDMPEGVGGRYSELSNSGLLPAAVCGIDIEEMLAGSAYMDELCTKENIYENPALFGAAIQFLAMKKGKNISVMMPYSHSLRYISDWYAQLWAESLGKKFDVNGKEVFEGQTPVKALGTTDQHSQVQLYTEGPFDKVFTFIRVESFRNDATIPNIYKDIESLSFYSNHKLSTLLKVEQIATEYALTKANRMNNTITLPQINAFTIGQLLYFFEVQTAFMGELLKINAFDQPGVEEGKLATFALLDRKGYEEKKKELDNVPTKDPKFIL